MDIGWIVVILVGLLPKNVASPCKRFFTTTDLQVMVEITATIFSRVIFFAAPTGMVVNKEKFKNN